MKITYCARDTKPFMMKFYYLATKFFINSLLFKGANNKINILILLHHAVATCLSIGSDHSKLRNCNDMQNIFKTGGIIRAQFFSHKMAF